MPVKMYLPDTTVQAVVFLEPENKQSLYVVGRDGMDFFEFMNCYGSVAKHATGVNLDGSEERFFLVWVADCMDPPLAVVRADDASDAQEWFVEELTWADISEMDLEDYYGEDGELSEFCYWTGRGKWANTEQIEMREIHLLRVEVR
jgi:hypothetical protein